MEEQVYNRFIGQTERDISIMRMSPRAKRLYRYDDWVEYLENSKGLKVEENFNDDYYCYIVGVERLRELTLGEESFKRAYQEIIFGVKRIER